MGQDGVHARQGSSLAGVNRENPGVGVGGAQCPAMQHIGKGIVVGESGRASDFVHHVWSGEGMTDDVQGNYRLYLNRGERLARLVFVDGGPDDPQQAGVTSAAAGVPAEGALDFLVGN